MKIKAERVHLQITSSKDLRPKLRTFIISSSDLLIKSSTVLIPARFRQLKNVRINPTLQLSFQALFLCLYHLFQP